MLFSATRRTFTSDDVISRFIIFMQFLYYYRVVAIARQVLLSLPSSPKSLATEITDFDRFFWDISTRLDKANFFFEKLLLLLIQSNNSLEFTTKSPKSWEIMLIMPLSGLQLGTVQLLRLPGSTPITMLAGTNLASARNEFDWNSLLRVMKILASFFASSFNYLICSRGSIFLFLHRGLRMANLGKSS